MKIIDENWYIENPDYSSNLTKMYNTLGGVFRVLQAYYFTDHTRTHSERIIESLICLFPFLFYGNNENKLNATEKFILFSAILLHDVGIQMTNEDVLRNILEKYEKKTRDEMNEFLNKQNVLDYVRERHHVLSKYWIKDNINDPGNLRSVYLGDKILAKYIGNVVESHGINFEKENDYIEITAYGKNRIRMGLLCTLLSLGDALDCDQRRIDYEALKTSKISLESRLHWMKHYYVDGIVLTPNLIEIYYSFPKVTDDEEKELYQKYFIKKTKYWIEKCFTVRGVFLFPVGAICRVIDIVHFSEDKDPLKEEEMLIIQEKYAEEILEESRKQNIGVLQYLVGVVVNDENKLLFVDSEELKKCLLEKEPKMENNGEIKDEETIKKQFKQKLEEHAQELLSKHWEKVFDNNKEKWEQLGKNKREGAIYHYYKYKISNEIIKENLNFNPEWLTIEDYFNKDSKTINIKYKKKFEEIK